METYIVVFESKDKSSEMKKYIKDFGTWGRITDNVWILVTDKTATEIRDDLFDIKKGGDTIFVVRSGGVSAWSATPVDNDWLKKYL